MMEDNIKINLKEIGCNTRNWVASAQDRDFMGALVNVELNHRDLQASELQLIRRIKILGKHFMVNEQEGCLKCVFKLE